MVREIKDAEGFVVRFEEGSWYKCKAEDYVRKASAKSEIELEKNALAVILAGGLDDVKPLLEPEQAALVEKYEAAVLAGIEGTAAQIRAIVDGGSELDQKTFAVEHLRNVPTEMRGLCFYVRKGASAFEATKALILKNTNSQRDVDASRWLFGNAAWPL